MKAWIHLLVWVAAWLSAAPALGERLNIAMVPPAGNDPYWAAIRDGAMQAATELGVTVSWRPPSRDNDPEAQVAEVDQLRVPSVAGIILAPLDGVLLRAPVRRAAEEGIPVIVVGQGLRSREYVSYIANGHELGGRLAAEHLARSLGGRGRVAVLRCPPGSPIAAARERGFVAALGAFPALQFVDTTTVAGTTAEGSLDAAADLLTRHRDADGALALDAVFCASGPVSTGMLWALHDAGLAGKVRLFGSDTSEDLALALAKRQIDALILEGPRRVGYLAVATMVRYLSGERVERRLETSVVLATPDNCTEPDVASQLSPPQAAPPAP